jgi:hypothetical protein
LPRPVTIPPARKSVIPNATITFPTLSKFDLNQVSGTLTNHGRDANLQDEGVLELAVPGGVQLVNVVTMKAMLDLPRSAVVLKRTGAKWTRVSDEHLIDLKDGTQEYLVGDVHIYS